MSLSAECKGRSHYSIEISDGFGQGNEFTCVACKQPMTFHRNLAGIKTQHFAHKVDSGCETEPETAEHIELKKWCYENLVADTKYKPDSVMVGNRKPDLLLEVNGKKVAVECQCSKISFDSWLDRTLDYALNKVYVLWLFSGKYNSRIADENGAIHTSLVEREAARIYFGRVYYAIPTTTGFAITPIRLRMSRGWKVKRLEDVGSEIKKFDLLLTESKPSREETGIIYLIARFYDKKWWGV